jgi:DASH complex subunit Duo1
MTNELHRAPDETYPADIDDVDEDLWGSPTKKPRSPKHKPIHHESSRSKTLYEETEVRDAALRTELDSVRKVNEAIEGVIESLNKAKSSMSSVNSTVSSATQLMQTWTRILSQTEHSQRLILSPNWGGATQDVADAEQETYARQREAERRETEEQERKAAATRKAEEEERRRMVNESAIESKVTRSTSTRGRGRGARAGGVVSSGYVAAGNTSMSGNTSSIGRGGSIGTRRPASGIGRGTMRGSRARGTGL